MSAIFLIGAFLAILVVVPTQLKQLQTQPKFDFHSLLWLLPGLGIAGYVLHRFGDVKYATAAIGLFSLAAVVAWIVAHFDGTDMESTPVVVIGLGALLLSIPWAGKETEVALALAVGAGFAAVALRSATATAFACSLGGMVAANTIASFTDLDHQVPHVGTTIGLLAAIVALVSLWPKHTTIYGQLITAASLAAVAAFTVRGADDAFHLYICVAIGSIAAWVTLMVLGEADDLMRRTLVAITWIAVASVAFTLAKAGGIGVAVVIGVLYAAINRSSALLSCIAPAVGIIIVRVFREMYHDASRGFDLGQHYAVIGLCFGLALPHLAAAANVRLRSFGTHAFAMLCLVTPAILMILTGAKGAYGLIVGLSLSVLMPATREAKSVAPAAAFSVGFAALIQYAWLQTWFTEGRVDRLKGAALPIAAVAVLVALWMFDNRRRTEVQS